MTKIVAYIYALCEPDTRDVRYVGKSINPIKRLKNYLSDRSSIRKARWLQSLHCQNKAPYILILETVDEVAWEEAERFWISYFRREGCDLTNHTSGGEGLNNPTIETREKIRSSRKQCFLSQDYRKRIFTPERAKKISEALSGRPKSPAHIALLPQNQKGYIRRPEVIAKIAAMQVGRKHSPETISLMREIHKGNQHGIGNKSRAGQIQSLEERAKKSATLKGRPKSEEHKAKLKLAALRRWEKFRKQSNEQLLKVNAVYEEDATESSDAGL